MAMSDGWNTRYCADCGTRSICYDSRDNGALLIRHRRCPECGTRWKTVEISAKRYDMLRNAERRIEECEDVEW